FAVTSGGGSLSGANALTNAAGIAAVGSWTLGTVAGSNTLSASTPGFSLTPVTFTATAAPGAPAHLTIVAGDNQSAPVASAVTTAPPVLVTDSFGNPVANITVAFAVTSGGGSLTGANAVTNAAGLATVGSWTLGPSPGSNTLSASTPGFSLTPVTFTATAVV